MIYLSSFNCTSLLTRVYDYAGCKEYCTDYTHTAALKMFDVFDKKQMYDSECN